MFADCCVLLCRKYNNSVSKDTEMKTTRRIEYTPEIRRKIEATIGCSPAMISQSLNYKRKTSLANAIRNEALRVGAKEIITADADKVLLIEGDTLIWQYGSCKVIIDLARKTIITKDDEKEMKSRLSAMADLVSFIKELEA